MCSKDVFEGYFIEKFKEQGIIKLVADLGKNFSDFTFD